MKDHEKIRCSLGIASALLDISEEEFVSRYVNRGAIYSDKLHQFFMRDVLMLYNASPDRQKTISYLNWRSEQFLEALALTLYVKDGVIYSTSYTFWDERIPDRL